MWALVLIGSVIGLIAVAALVVVYMTRLPADKRVMLPDGHPNPLLYVIRGVLGGKVASHVSPPLPALPDVTVSAPLRVSGDDLAEYRSMCGFGLEDAGFLPATYPQVR
jgi:hypothetical protein